MEYNTTKQPLILPEYGRNVQMMADYLLTIDDRERRTEAAKELVSIMVNMNPAVRETKDYRQKMWNFLAEMCEYKLDVDFPFPITKVTDLPKPEKLQYNLNDIRFRHYGYTVERMIKAAVELPEGEEKEVLVRMIANNMKRNYVLWNQKSVTDEIIVSDLLRLSQGRLSLPNDVKLMNVSVQAGAMMGMQKRNNFKKKNNNNNQGKKNNNNNRNNNNNNNNKKPM